MGKTLKVCLAMGGGVSLGSFSGAALTESLKTLILFGKDEEGNPYDKVIVDGASGASAGAIALSIMIKSLMDYEAMISILNNVPGRTEISKDSILQKINKRYGVIPKNKEEVIIALEVAEIVQEQIWVKELTIEKLFGNTTRKGYQPNVDGSFGLLDRNSLLNIARTYIVGKQRVNQEKIQLLDNRRLIFACSITNASPMSTDIKNPNRSIIEQNAINSTASFNHSELRVIDFKFDPSVDNSLENWIVFSPSEGPDNTNPMHMSLDDTKSWAVLTSTVLACGAFPIAFDPVILERYKEEYLGGGWPTEFPEQKATHNFAFVDGGTFNNEPIKEAFKIGAFNDFDCPEKEYDRVILFVDPIVRKEEDKPLTIKSLSPNLSEIGKMKSSVSSLVSILRNQGNVKEQSKIIEVLENFKLKEDLVSFYVQSDSLHNIISASFIEIVLSKIEKKAKGDSISLGSKTIIKYFNKKLKELNDKEIEIEVTKNKGYTVEQFKGKNIEEVLSPSDLTEVTQKFRPTLLDTGRINEQIIAEIKVIFASNIPDEEKVKKIFTLLELKTDNEKNRFAQAVFLIFTELTLNTLGKFPNAQRVPILPINSNLELIDLPGAEIEAFAGFASEKSRKYAFEYGKYSALRTLSFPKIRERSAYLTTNEIKPLLKKTESDLKSINFFDSKEYLSDLESLTNSTLKRIMGLLSISYLKAVLIPLAGTLFSPILLLSGVLNFLRKIVSKLTKNQLRKAIETAKNIELSQITISIKAKKKTPNKLLIKTNGGITHKVKLNKPEKEKYRYTGTLYFSSQFPEIGLVGEATVSKPEKLDPNLEVENYNKQLRDRISLHKIKSIESKRFLAKNIKLRNPNEDFLSQKVSLASYYLNPTLELDFTENDKPTWNFIDNTTPLYTQLLNLKAIGS